MPFKIPLRAADWCSGLYAANSRAWRMTIIPRRRFVLNVPFKYETQPRPMRYCATSVSSLTGRIPWFDRQPCVKKHWLLNFTNKPSRVTSFCDNFIDRLAHNVDADGSKAVDWAHLQNGAHEVVRLLEWKSSLSNCFFFKIKNGWGKKPAVEFSVSSARYQSIDIFDWLLNNTMIITRLIIEINVVSFNIANHILSTFVAHYRSAFIINNCRNDN